MSPRVPSPPLPLARSLAIAPPRPLSTAANAVYALDPLPHVVASVGTLALAGLAQGTVNPALSPLSSCPRQAGEALCNPDTLWGFDRSVIGNDSARWRRISDYGELLGIVLPFVAVAAEHLPIPAYSPSASPGAAPSPRAAAFRAAGFEATVALEALSLAAGLNTLTKYAVRRARPKNYVSTHTSAQDQLSFPSGHSAAVAAGLAELSTTFALRHPHSRWRYAVMGGSLALTAATAYGRVAGGRHFYTDVIGGALLGATVGIALPLAYRNTPLRLTPLSACEGGGPCAGVTLHAAY